MLTVQQILEIASRHFTAMADAMVAACIAWSLETGTPLDIPERQGQPTHMAGPADGVDWERMVRGNSDSRWQHV